MGATEPDYVSGCRCGDFVCADDGHVSESVVFLSSYINTQRMDNAKTEVLIVCYLQLPAAYDVVNFIFDE